MKKSKPKRPRDLNQLAASIVAEATGEKSADPTHAAAVALGRLVGLKGGKARAKALSPKKRKEIARKAEQKRWGKPKKPYEG